MLEKLVVNGKLEGTFEGQGFRLEFKERSGKMYFTSVGTLKILKDAFFPSLKKYKNDPNFKAMMEEMDIEVFLNDELILRVGKSAKTNFVSSILGVSHIEVVSNSQMSDLMSLM